MDHQYDVIVVGAGFAGATAARECATRGLRTLVLEGRDRLGGRTWTTRLSDGELIEIGGTYVHWLQPHTWSEITRYGLDGDVVRGGEDPEWVLSPKGDGLAWSPIDDHLVREKALLERVFEESWAALPRPYDPLAGGERVAELDQMSVRDRLDELDLSADDDAFLVSLFGTEANADVAEASFLGLMRWWAPAGHGYDAMSEAVFAYKLKHGTVSLLEAMLADGGAEVRLSSPVTTIVQDDAGVEVTCAGGDTFSAAAVVVATSTGVWPHLDVQPALSPDRVEAARDGMQVRHASKTIVVLRGEARRFYAQPRAGHPIGLMWTTRLRNDDEQVAVLFGSPAMRDADDAAAVEAAIKDLLPHVEVAEMISGTYYDDDDLARGGWPLLKRGYLTRYAPHERFAEPEGRLVFATADIAKLWGSFIDGAIETGLRAGRQARQLVESDAGAAAQTSAPTA
jgi:monoamine oxidase